MTDKTKKPLRVSAPKAKPKAKAIAPMPTIHLSPDLETRVAEHDMITKNLQLQAYIDSLEAYKDAQLEERMYCRNKNHASTEKYDKYIQTSNIINFVMLACFILITFHALSQ